MRPIELVLEKLRVIGKTVRQTGNNQWAAKCPSHDDRQPSLSISVATDGKVLLHCHSGCDLVDICSALNIKESDLFPSNGSESHTRYVPEEPKQVYPTVQAASKAIAQQVRGHFVKSWTYPYADGREALVVLRFDLSDGKTFRPIHHNGDGYIQGDPDGPLPLYGLSNLNSEQRIYATEGEKAADAARSIGLSAVTSAHGSKCAKKTDWTPLAGKEIIILPDHDEAGQKYAVEVAGILSALNPPAKIKIVELPGLSQGEDIFDYLERRDSVEPEALKAGIEKLAGSALLVEAADGRAEKNTDLPGHGKSQIHCIIPFQEFPTTVLPEPMRSFVTTTSKAIGCDASYIALPLLSALASAIGNSRRINLKNNSWTEPAVIWTAIVGESGTMKSPAIELPLKPIVEKQAQAMLKFEHDMNQYLVELGSYKTELSEWKKQGREDGETQPKPPKKPVCQRFWCSDTTVEALADRLSEAPRGLLLVRDELAGWLNGFNQYKGGRGGDSAHWLSVFGARALLMDRKSGDKTTIYVPRAAVCITGGIQPDILRRVLGQEHFDDGMAARLLLAMPPRKPKIWTDVGVPESLESQLADVFDHLLELEPNTPVDGNPYPVDVPLTAEGQEVFINFYNSHNTEQARFFGAEAAAWSKLEVYAARLALVIHYVRWAANDVSLRTNGAIDEQSMAAGVALSRWFGYEARRVYRVLGESSEVRKQRRLLELIQQKEGRVTVRHWQRIRSHPTAKDAEAELNELVEVGAGYWQSPQPGASGGRPTKYFVSDADKTPAGERESGVPSVSKTSEEVKTQSGNEEWTEI